jgi:uncharacterized membrane protein YhaH (DUF805 family)
MSSNHSVIIISLVLVILQNFATAPFFLQRMFIRFAQPFFLSGLIVLGGLILRNVIYTSIVAVFLLFSLVYLVVRYAIDKKKSNQSILPVTPTPVDMSSIERENTGPLDLTIYPDLSSSYFSSLSSNGSVENLSVRINDDNSIFD